MPFNSDGTVTRQFGNYSGLDTFEQIEAANIGILATHQDASLNDLVEMIGQCVHRGGINSPSANLPMDGNKHTGVGDATERNQYASLAQLQNLIWFVPPDEVAGTANAITLGPSPAISAYSSGQTFRFFAEAANTGPVTLDVNGLGAQSVLLSSGAAIAAGAISNGQLVTVSYNGTNFISDITPTAQTTDLGPLTMRVATLEGSQTTQDTAISANTTRSTTNQATVGGFNTRITALEAFFLTRALGRLAADLALTSTSTWQTVATLTITPQSTTQRIRVAASLLLNTNPDAADIRIRRGSTDIVADTQLVGDEDNNEPQTITLQDTPGSTSQQTYTLQAKRSGGTAVTMQAGSSLYCEGLPSAHIIGFSRTTTPSGSGWNTVVSASITPGAATDIIQLLAFSHFLQASGATGVLRWRIQRGSTVIFTDLMEDSIANEGARISGMFFDIPGATTATTYTLQVQKSVSGAATSTYFSTLELRNKSAGL